MTRPGRERAEDVVEADVAGEEDERGEDEDRKPDRRLPGCVHGLLQHADDVGRTRANRRPSGERDEGAEADEEQHLGDRSVHRSGRPR